MPCITTRMLAARFTCPRCRSSDARTLHIVELPTGEQCSVCDGCMGDLIATWSAGHSVEAVRRFLGLPGGRR